MSAAALGLALLLSGCEEPRPRSFADFMEDQIAREGTLARCNADSEAALNDLECANARRAAVALALKHERERREELERESERKLEEMRRLMAEAERIARESALAAAAAEREAYERLWREQSAALNARGAEAEDGAPAPDAPTDRLSFIDVPAMRGAEPEPIGAAVAR